jgi:uncharacterized membrane protein
MKTAIMLGMTLALAFLFSCGADDEFKINVPFFTKDIKQGELLTFVVSLQRGPLFKRDITLTVTIPKGINVSPSNTTVKAEDKADVQFQISAPSDAALGDYTIVVVGTPTTGELRSVDFKVKVVSP